MKPEMHRTKDSESGLKAGFTLIEILVVVVVLSIGFLALMHLEAGVLRTNTTAKEMVAGMSLARHVFETIRMEALEWTNDSTQSVDQTKFVYLKHVNDEGGPVKGKGSGWRRAFSIDPAQFQMVNQLGRDANYDPGAMQRFPDTRDRRFCVQYRLTWVEPNFLIRVEVRVLWPRELGGGLQYQACPLGMENDLANVYFVTYPSTVMKNTFVRS